MIEYKIVGGEYMDSMGDSPFLTFEYTLFAKSRDDAMEKFHTIFPGCVCVTVAKA
jgi:hypothetical protein